MSASELRTRPRAAASMPTNGTNGVRPAERPNARAEALTAEDRERLLRYMLTMRLSEERALSLYKQGKVPGSFYDGCGQEAIGVGAAYALAPEDRMCILHRDLGAHFVRGVEPERYLANYMGRSGRRHRRARREHALRRSRPRLRRDGLDAPRHGARRLGLALAFKLRREPRVAMTFFGEGSTANGQWHEAMNLAGVQRLPVVFMLENNGFAYSTPNDARVRGRPGRAGGRATASPASPSTATTSRRSSPPRPTAAERARAGDGPTLIECRTMRMHGHGAHDDMSYVPEEMLAEWRDRDPIDRYRERLVAEHGFEAERIDGDPAPRSQRPCARRRASGRLADAERSPTTSTASSRPSGGRWATAGRRGPATTAGGGA